MTTNNFINSQTPNTPFSFRNKIINGNFDIWQRGVSQTTSGYGSDDRWTNVIVSSTATFSRQSFALYDASAPQGSTYFARTVVTTAGTATSACNKTQRIEGVRTLAGKTVTVSFWAKADASRNIAVDLFQYFGSGGSPSSTVEGIGATKVGVTNSWQKFTLSATLPTLSGKTLGTDGKDCLALRIWFDAGSNYNTQTASLGNQSGTFDISQVQVEEGVVATPFEQRPIGLEYELCKRYYQEVFTGGPTGGGLWTGLFTNSLDGYCWLTVYGMRAAPTPTVSGATLRISGNGVAFNLNAISVYGDGPNYTVQMRFTGTGGIPFQSGYISFNAVGGQLALDAEL